MIRILVNQLNIIQVLYPLDLAPSRRDSSTRPFGDVGGMAWPPEERTASMRSGLPRAREFLKPGGQVLIP
jgi:hypothetical protein